MLVQGGTEVFCSIIPPVVNSNFSQNSFIYAGGAWKGKDYAKNKKIIDTYNQKYNDSIEFIDPVLQKNYGKTNTKTS